MRAVYTPMRLLRIPEPFNHPTSSLSQSSMDSARSRTIMPRTTGRVLFLDGIAERGRDLFRFVCERDLEGIVGKSAHGTYQQDGSRTSRLKIKNPEYSQIDGRHELFEAGEVRSRRAAS